MSDERWCQAPLVLLSGKRGLFVIRFMRQREGVICHFRNIFCRGMKVVTAARWIVYILMPLSCFMAILVGGLIPGVLKGVSSALSVNRHSQKVQTLPSHLRCLRSCIVRRTDVSLDDASRHSGGHTTGRDIMDDYRIGSYDAAVADCYVP